MGYYDIATSFESLYGALGECCNGVRWKPSVIRYEHDGLLNTLNLMNDLRDGSYRPSPYSVFQVHEPKDRTIIAPKLRDRQFHRSLCDAGLYEDVTEHLIRDNYACQRGRGTNDALDRLTYQLRRYYRRHGSEGWVLKCDIRHFFAETPHDVAKAACAKRISDERALDAVCGVIDSFVGYEGTSDEGGVRRGIGLGCQVDQLVELMVLDDIDHMIKERLGIKCYARYMDDFVLVHESGEYLADCRDTIEWHLASLGLALNEKTSMQPLSHGIWFLKWKFVLTDTGKVLRLVDPRKPARWRRVMRSVWARECAGELPEGATRGRMQSWLSHLGMGDTWRVRARLIRYYTDLTGDGFFGPGKEGK